MLLVLKSLMQEVAVEERLADQALRHQDTVSRLMQEFESEERPVYQALSRQDNISPETSNPEPPNSQVPLPCNYFTYIFGTSTGG
jgi:hypothetical protein